MHCQINTEFYLFFYKTYKRSHSKFDQSQVTNEIFKKANSNVKAPYSRIMYIFP